jgi:hypothetical protein
VRAPFAESGAEETANRHQTCPGAVQARQVSTVRSTVDEGPRVNVIRGMKMTVERSIAEDL